MLGGEQARPPVRSAEKHELRLNGAFPGSGTQASYGRVDQTFGRFGRNWASAAEIPSCHVKNNSGQRFLSDIIIRMIA